MTDQADNRPLPPRIEDVPPERLVSIGGPIRVFDLTLRIFGDDLDPDKVTALLGAVPTSCQRKGETLPGRYKRMAERGAWFLEDRFDQASSPEINEAVRRMLGRLNPDPSVWADLNDRFDVDLFVGIELPDQNRGFSLLPSTIRMLAQRGLEIDFDIYC